MTSKPRKKAIPTSKAPKSSHFFIPWLQFLVGVLYEYGKYTIGAIIVVLVIVIIMGDLFTRAGLILVLAILAFLALFGLNKWLDKR